MACLVGLLKPNIYIYKQRQYPSRMYAVRPPCFPIPVQCTIFKPSKVSIATAPTYTCANVQAFIVSTHIPLLALARISTDETLHCLTARLPSLPPTRISFEQELCCHELYPPVLVDRCSSGCHILDFMYSSSEPSGFSICALPDRKVSSPTAAAICTTTPPLSDLPPLSNQDNPFKL